MKKIKSFCLISFLLATFSFSTAEAETNKCQELKEEIHNLEKDLLFLDDNVNPLLESAMMWHPIFCPALLIYAPVWEVERNIIDFLVEKGLDEDRLNRIFNIANYGFFPAGYALNLPYFTSLAAINEFQKLRINLKIKELSAEYDKLCSLN